MGIFISLLGLHDRSIITILRVPQLPLASRGNGEHIDRL